MVFVAVMKFWLIQDSSVAQSLLHTVVLVNLVNIQPNTPHMAETWSYNTEKNTREENLLQKSFHDTPPECFLSSCHLNGEVNLTVILKP